MPDPVLLITAVPPLLKLIVPPTPLVKTIPEFSPMPPIFSVPSVKVSFKLMNCLPRKSRFKVAESPMTEPGMTPKFQFEKSCQEKEPAVFSPQVPDAALA